MAKRLVWVWFGVMLILLISLVNAKSFSLDPCNGDTIITEDANNIYADSPCFNLQFPKDYGNPIIALDKYNNDYFDLMAMQLYDEKTSNPADHKTISFGDKPMIPSFSGNTIYYQMNDGVNDILLYYTIDGSSFKQGIEIHNWVSSWVNGDLVLRTKYHKENTASSHFVNSPAIVDGIEQPLIVESIIEQDSTFYHQTLWSGVSFTSLYQDPLYQVDYSPSPAIHLQDGFWTGRDSEYSSAIDITAGVSDNSSATKYLVSRDYNTYSDYLKFSYKFDEVNGTTIADYNLNNPIDLNLFGTPILNSMGIDGSGIDTDGVDDYGIRNENISVLANENFVMCVAVMDEGVSTSGMIIDTKGGGIAQGIELSLTPSDTISYFIRRGITQTTLYSSTTIDDSTWHTVCIVSNSTGYIALYLDSVLEASATGITGAMVSSVPLYFAQTHAGLSRYSQETDELCSWIGEGIDTLAVVNQYNQTYCGNPDGYAISGRWSQTYNPMYNWYLTIKKETLDDVSLYIYTYNDSDTLSSVYTIDSLSGIGWFNTNINSILNYELNNLSFNYSMLRFWTYPSAEISEVRLREEGNDTTIPIITNCFLNDTYLDNNEIVRLQCNVTDDIAVHEVNGTVNGIKYLFSKNYDIYYKDLTCSFPFNGFNNWTSVEAVDMVGLYNSTTLNLSFYCNFSMPCIEDWVLNPINCLINDSYHKTYYDANACGTNYSLPSDNGTYQYCNYCSEDLTILSETECYFNGSSGQKNMTYTDNNYFTCCVITNIVSDCSILYSPYNDTIITPCAFTTTDFLLDVDSELYFGWGFGGLNSDKVHGKIWINDTNGTYTCLSYVKTISGQVVQTNPPYTKRTDSTLSIIPKEIEDREYFITQDGLANIYWTDSNLIIDGRTYIFGVECSRAGQRLVSEKTSIVLYDNVNEPVTRWYWFINNMWSIVLGLILLFFIVILLAWYIRKLRYG